MDLYNTRKNLIFTAILLLISNFVSAYDPDDYEYFDANVTNKLVSMERASKPEIINNYIIFSYEPKELVSSVYAVFDHEKFAEKHYFSKNSNNIYFLVYDIPVGKKEFIYRFNENGLWTTDPKNPTTKINKYGFKMSQVILKANELVTQQFTPIAESDNTYKFILEDEPGKQITITGDFNMWDPFMYKMTETSPGHYEISLQIHSANFYYYFVKNGNKILDRLNMNRAMMVIQGEVNEYKE